MREPPQLWDQTTEDPSSSNSPKETIHGSFSILISSLKSCSSTSLSLWFGSPQTVQFNENIYLYMNILKSDLY